MIVKLNNQVLFKAENSLPQVFEDVKISYHNTIARKIRPYRDCDNCRTRPIFSNNGFAGGSIRRPLIVKDPKVRKTLEDSHALFDGTSLNFTIPVQVSTATRNINVFLNN